MCVHAKSPMRDRAAEQSLIFSGWQFSNYSHGKNGFAERSKILAGYRKVILLNYQNNRIETNC